MERQMPPGKPIAPRRPRGEMMPVGLLLDIPVPTDALATSARD